MSKAWVSALLIASLATLARGADAGTGPERPWQSLSNPKAAELAAHFATPPTESSLTFTWGWSGEVTPAVIATDLDYIKKRGVSGVTIECGRVTNAPYLTPAYFDLVKVVIAEAKKRDMHIWFINESKYPSGFAGGKFSAEKPDLRMQLMEYGPSFTVAVGATIDQAVPADTICAVAVDPAGNTVAIETTANKIHWTAPAFAATVTGPGIAATPWQIVTIRHIFDTAPTRSSTSPNGAKDKHDSLMDYLNPAATRQFLDWTEEQYKKAVGEEFGKTILGFRGDEPEYPEGAPQPFTPAILDEFQKKKGYDPRPWLPAILTNQSDQQRRAHADYVDIWSDLYGKNFFGQEAQWCADNHLELQYHVDHEERQLSLVRSDGDFFKCMRYVQSPGIDTIQNQITPGKVADFPKFASSAAHLFGHPTSMCEAFAAYQTNDIPIATWVVNHLMVRGINRLEFMFFSSGSGARAGRGYLGDAEFPTLAAHTNRASWLLAQGKPAAQIGLYCPTSSFWLNDNFNYQSFLVEMQSLLEHQRDFDLVDEQALAGVLKLDGAELKNLSGQGYKAIIVPQCSVISKAAMDNLQAFAKAGGKVITMGAGPALVSDQSILKATKPGDLSWTFRESTNVISPGLIATLPAPDVALDSPAPPIKYNHRHLADAEIFMFFNESDQPLQRTATLAASGPAQHWNPDTGTIETLATTGQNTALQIRLDLKAYETFFVVAGPGVAIKQP